MNEQIRELVRQAGLDDADFPIENWDNVPLAKLAELIVLDIINVLESTNEIRHIASTTYDIGVVEGTIDRSINAITEQYGMKNHYRNKNERTMGR
jgi:hypothetical protein